MHVYVKKKLNSYRLGVKKDTNFLLAIGIRGKFMHYVNIDMYLAQLDLLL